MSTTGVAAVAASFGRDIEAAFDQITALVARARADDVRLLVLPEATLGGYLAHLDGDGSASEPPPLDLDGPEVRRLASLAGDMVVCAGLCEAGPGGTRYNTAVAVSGDGVLGTHRKVHQPLREDASYRAGDGFATFDTPVGRLGMLICFDKAFPESARALAVDGAQIVACMSAWPSSATAAAADIAQDRWTRRFDVFDVCRALENQVLWVSANQSGTFGRLRFVASAKVVSPAGEVLATTGVGPGVAAAYVDVTAQLAAARRVMCYLDSRRPAAYTHSGSSGSGRGAVRDA